MARDRLLVGERLLEVEDGLEAAVVLGGKRRPLVPRSPAKHGRHLLPRVGARMLELLFLQLRSADAVAPVVPELRLERSKRHPTSVLGLVGEVADDSARELEVSALRHLLLAEEARDHHR